jgi:hypothetical protein
MWSYFDHISLKMQFNKRGPNFFSAAEFMATLPGYLDKSWQHCTGVHCTAGNSSQILVALPSRESKVHGFHLGRENSKMEKEKILSGLCKQISLRARGFSSIRKKWFKICPGI